MSKPVAYYRNFLRIIEGTTEEPSVLELCARALNGQPVPTSKRLAEESRSQEIRALRKRSDR